MLGVKDDKGVGAAIATARNAAGLTQADLARRIREWVPPGRPWDFRSLSCVTVNRIENGARRLGARELGVICLILDVNPLHILVDDPPTHIAPFRAAKWPTAESAVPRQSGVSAIVSNAADAAGYPRRPPSRAGRRRSPTASVMAAFEAANEARREAVGAPLTDPVCPAAIRRYEEAMKHLRKLCAQRAAEHWRDIERAQAELRRLEELPYKVGIDDDNE